MNDAAPIARRLRDWLLCAFFLAALALPLADQFLRLDPSADLTENRKLAARPAAPKSLAGLAASMREWENYHRDHLGFRRFLIRSYNWIHVKALRVSPTPLVDLGKGDWLFLGVEGEDSRRTKQYSPAEAAKWRRVMEERRDWLAAKGVPYVFAVAPNKSSVYPEHMADRFNPVRPDSLLDQFLALARRDPALGVLDLREPLIAGKSERAVFPLSDGHWNDYGAYLGYSAILAPLADKWPSLRPAPLENFRFQYGELEMDLAKVLSLQCCLDDRTIEMVPLEPRRAKLTVLSLNPNTTVTEIDEPSLPRAVVIRDSYGVQLYPFLAEHFSRAVFYWDSLGFPADLILKEKPDVVIHQMVERHLLPSLIPDNPPGVAGYKPSP